MERIDKNYQWSIIKHGHDDGTLLDIRSQVSYLAVTIFTSLFKLQQRLSREIPTDHAHTACPMQLCKST